ncbi:MAG: DUF177 domain-containing protein [Methylotenera sp.]|nr:DUF177 domain-containing protein [Methylotenera sp.]
MSQPLLIDNIAFAKRNEHLTGTLSQVDCPRLSEFLASQYPLEISKPEAAESCLIKFSLIGETNAVGQQLLHLAVAAKLITLCQRCLEEMPLDLNLKFDYLITYQNLEHAEVEAFEDNDEFDLQEASQAMDLRSLIEDEIIMALPIAPVHTQTCGKLLLQSGEKTNPFAVLKGLVNGDK